MDRYERRARSRRKNAIRDYDAQLEAEAEHAAKENAPESPLDVVGPKAEERGHG